MCVLLDLDNEIKIAPWDIICYKVLFNNSNGVLHPPIYYDHIYELNKLYSLGGEIETRLIETKWGSAKQTEQGMYSYVKKDYAWKWINRYGYIGFVVYKAIIPKGSKYYATDEIFISDAIIIKEKTRPSIKRKILNFFS